MGKITWASGAPCWWELSAPLMVAVERRMGLEYPRMPELGQAAHEAYALQVDWRDIAWPPPDEDIVNEELERLQNLRLNGWTPQVYERKST